MAIDLLEGDDPTQPKYPDFWSGSAPSLAPSTPSADFLKQINTGAFTQAAQQSSPGYTPPKRTASGNPQQDFLDLAGGYAPSAKNLEAFFPQFQAMYPGWNLKKNASGYADAITGPNGEIIDTQRNAGYDQSDAWQWNVAGGPGFQAGPQIFDDPATKILESLINGRLSSLSQPIQNPAMDAFLKQATQAIEQLNAPVYSEGEEKALRVKYFDQLEQERQTALRDMTARMGALGHGPQSGTIPLALQKVNEYFNKLKAQKENELFTGTIQERQRRLQQALSIGSQAATMQGNQLTQQDNREREAVTTGSILPDLTERRLGMTLNSLGAGGSSPSSLMSSIAQLMNQNQTQQQTSATNWQNIMDYIAQILQGARR